MLAKEECKEALDYLFDNALDNDYMSILDSKMYDILEQLIDEHFDNSPLKFEELKPNMWVWDNKHKFYGKIYSFREMLNICIPECLPVSTDRGLES